MGFDLVFGFFDSCLIGCVAKYDEHKKPCEEGYDDHSHPWIHIPEGNKKQVKNLAEDLVECPHFL
jgi:hypothetical protein